MNTITPNGKVALVTGANSGIGKVTARELALQGWHVFLACRNETSTQAVLDNIAQRSGGTARAEFLPLDLGDLASVRICAERFLARGLPLHLLIANAGLAGQRGMSASGFELSFGVCHIGHFLLTQLLMDALKAAAPSRIVVVASKAHRHAKGIDFEALRRPTQSAGGLKEYAVAKLANILFAAELARRLKGSGVTSYAVHPGVVATNVWRAVPWPLDGLIKRFMISEDEGAETTLHCATDPVLAGDSGLYYDNCRSSRPSEIASDANLARTLWGKSEEWVGVLPSA
ncbi:SDR family oxidoreductase [Nevskia sp.]|uniref:SDR family oxidoreductase n=1 Tax=Nevskia sp. TaxID=1929292 RepID=UPI0025F90544|nr:SDR family oxidoreductase [Nevskia sp.]